MASAVSVLTRADAASAIVPSPPATTMRSAPSRTALSICLSSDFGSQSSMSKAPASCSASRAAWPEPDSGLTKAGIGRLDTRARLWRQPRTNANAGALLPRPTVAASAAEDLVDRGAELREFEGLFDDLAGGLAREVGGFVGDEIAGGEDEASQDFGGVLLDAVVELDARQAG